MGNSDETVITYIADVRLKNEYTIEYGMVYATSHLSNYTWKFFCRTEKICLNDQLLIEMKFLVNRSVYIHWIDK